LEEAAGEEEGVGAAVADMAEGIRSMRTELRDIKKVLAEIRDALREKRSQKGIEG
jgi:hypothetical protein